MMLLTEPAMHEKLITYCKTMQTKNKGNTNAKLDGCVQTHATFMSCTARKWMGLDAFKLRWSVESAGSAESVSQDLKT